MAGLEIVKLICLFTAVMFTTVNLVRAYHAREIPAMNFVIQALGMTGFIYLQWLI